VSEKSDIDAEKAHLLRRDAEWVLAASEGRDIERILSFWTDDAVVPPLSEQVFLLRMNAVETRDVRPVVCSWSMV
jgi:hypothetical protein